VNGGDTVFVRCVSVCVSVCSGPVNQTSLERLKLWTSNFTCMFQGQSRHDPLKFFEKGASAKKSLGEDMHSQERLLVLNGMRGKMEERGRV